MTSRKPPAWRPSTAVTQLRAEVDRLWRFRDRTSDGIKGDARHAAAKSDHNPDPETGIVRALDIDEDLRGAKVPNPAAANALAQQLVALAQAGEARLAYVIFEGRIASAAHAWKWRPYSGLNAHLHHIHVSFTTAGDNDGTPFGLTR